MKGNEGRRRLLRAGSEVDIIVASSGILSLALIPILVPGGAPAGDGGLPDVFHGGVGDPAVGAPSRADGDG